MKSRVLVSLVALIGILQLPALATPKPKHDPHAPRLFEVSAPTGDVSYFQVTPDGRTSLFRDPSGRVLSIENDLKVFPGSTLRFAQGKQELQIFTSMLFYEQKQPLPVIYVINGEYVAGIDGNDLMERAKKEFHRAPEEFRNLLMNFYLFAEKGIPDLGPPSAAIETLLYDGTGELKAYDTHTRLIEDAEEIARIRSMMTP